MNPLEVNPDNIEQYRQNLLHRIAEDFHRLYGVPREETAKILLARGVGKWLKVRQELIRLKNHWRSLVTISLQLQRAWKAVRLSEETKAPNEKRKAHEQELWLRGYRAGVEQCRAEVRALCHSSRWAWPSRDQGFIDRYLTQDRSKEVDDDREAHGRGDVLE